jgi:hypothetical protein
MGCAQIKVQGGVGIPGPLVSFPGVYTMEDPIFLANIHELTEVRTTTRGKAFINTLTEL